MRVDKPSNNITYVDFTRPQVQKKETKPKKFAYNTEASNAIKESNVLVDFRTFSASHPNIGKSDELKLLSYMKDMGYHDITLEKVETGIKKYYEDAEELYPMFKIAEDYLSAFEEKISRVDFSKLKNIINIFGDGWDNSKRDVKKYIKGDSDKTPSRKSNETMKQMAREYISILEKEYPELEVVIEEDENGNTPKNAMQISIIDGNNTIMMFFEDFIKSLQRGKLTGNELLIFDEEENAKYYYIYDSSTKTMNKISGATNSTIGSIKKEAYDENGKAHFYIDENEPEDDESGPLYYALCEYLSEFNEKIEEELSSGMENYTKDVNLDDFLKMVQNDADALYYYQNHDFDFMYSCMREGAFNLDVAEVSDLFIEAGRTYAKDCSIPQEYVNHLVSLIEEKDHTFDDDLIDIAEGLLIKELKSEKDYHELIYSILSFIKTDKCEENFALGYNLSDDKLYMEEVKTVFEKISNADTKKQKKMINKFNAICFNQDNRTCNTDKTIFEYFTEEFK